ncbi:MAG TPA: hypothetical protein VMK12_33065 [Anaeromyxobacteraceae bacterium]|nr:hypothetical protein [Anaeromyxobacteraceae bacterium]
MIAKEANARLSAALGKLLGAPPGPKARLEARIADTRSEVERRVERLGLAWALTKEALEA